MPTPNAQPTPPSDADSAYLGTLQHRQDLQAAAQFIHAYSTAKPEEQADMLSRNNLTPDTFRQFAHNAGLELQENADQAGQKVNTLESATAGAHKAEKALYAVGTMGGLLMSMGLSAAIAVPAALVLDKSQELGGDASAQAFRGIVGPNHPIGEYVARLLGSGLTGSALLGPLAAAKGMMPSAGENMPTGSVASSPPTGEPATGEAAPPNAEAGPPSPSDQPTSPAPDVSRETPEEPLAPPTPEENIHNMQAMTDYAKANPYTKADVSKMELSGSGFHATLETPLSAQDALRLHYYAADQVRETLEMARMAKDFGNQDAQAEYEKLAKDLTETTIPRWNAVRHQAGLTTRAFGEPASAETATIKDVIQSLQESGADPDRMLKALGSISNVDERQELMDRATDTDWTAKGALYRVYLNSLLSWNSVGKKAASDAANIAFQIPRYGTAEFGDRIYELATGQDYGSVGVKPGETMALARGMVQGIGQALRYGKDSAISGRPVFNESVGFLDNAPAPTADGSPWEGGYIGRALDLYGHMLSGPSRAITGVDQFSKAMQYNMEMNVLAQRQGYIEASQEGLTGTELSARIAEISKGYIEKPASWMVDQAMQTAKTNTFTQDLEGSLAKFDAFRKSNIYTRILLPFFKTPVNITIQGIHSSPLAPLAPAFRETVSEGGPEASLALSKMALGSSVMAYWAHHVLAGNVTGNIPPNLPPNLKNDWLRSHQPYSIKSGDRWINYEGVAEPWAQQLGLVADLVPTLPYLNSGEASQRIGQAASAFAGIIDRQPMWGAIHQLSQALDSEEKGKGGSAAEFIGREIGAMVPGQVANVGGYMDEIKRQRNSWMDEVYQRIPWLKKNGLPTLDDWGSPVVVPPGFAYNEFPSFKAPTKGEDTATDELIRLHNQTGFNPPQIPKALGGPADNEDPSAPPLKMYGATLTPEEQNRWKELRGNTVVAGAKLKERIENMIDSAQYQDASEPARANMFSDVFSAYQVASQVALMKERPEIIARMKQAAARKVSAYHTPGAGVIGAP